MKKIRKKKILKERMLDRQDINWKIYGHFCQKIRLEFRRAKMELR